MMIKENDLILLYTDAKRNYLIRIEKDKRFHTDKGFVDLSSLIGRDLGEEVKTNLGESFYILKPDLFTLVMKINRKTQIIYPKDIGLITMKSGIYPGARAIECGTGSGSLTTALANFLRPTGHIYSYERREEFLENARKNLTRYGLDKFVTFKGKEVAEEFDETEVDFVMIDIGSPWDLVEPAYKALKPSGRLATICPTFEQLTKTVFTLEEKGFTSIETVEILTRRILVRRGKTRPEQRIPSHTGFLTFAVKTK